MGVATLSFSLDDLEKSVTRAMAQWQSRPDNAVLVKAQIDAEKAQEELRTARETDKVKKMRSISDISIIGRALLAHVRVETERQKYRRAFCVSRKMPTTNMEGKWIGRDFKVVSPENFEGKKQVSLSQCLKLVEKCGGLLALRDRGDECTQFLEGSIALCGRTASEIEGTLPVCANTGNVGKSEQELKLKETKAELNQAMIPLQNTGLWKLQDPTHIGRFLCARLRHELATQGHRLELLKNRGEDLMPIQGVLTGKRSSKMPPYKLFELRDQVRNDCIKLAARSGGMRAICCRCRIPVVTFRKLPQTFST